MAKQMCWRDAREKPVPVMKMSEVEETVVQWLWYPFIPFGKVTLIQGNPGKGKTWLAMAIAAYCTNGKELPNALPIEPFNVLYQTAEDGIADTIKPRLAKCGADMTRVRFINEEEKQLSMTDDRIEKAIRQNNVRLMIMDPIQAYLGANVDMNRANEIRPLFRHLLWSSIFVTLMANKIGGLQFGNYRNCQISSRVFHTAVAALPLTKANRSDFE